MSKTAGIAAELLELAYDAILVRDESSQILYWNPGAEKLYGWPKEYAIGKRSHELLGTIFPVPFEQVKESLRTTGRWEGELQHTVRGGNVVIVASRWVVRSSPSDQLEILEINRDITAEKSAIEELRRTREEFRELLESAPDPMVIVNQAGEIAMVNAQTEKKFGYRREELLGTKVELLAPARFRGRHPEHREQYARDPHVRAMGEGRELYGLRKDGTEFPVEISLSPMKTERGLLVISSIRDISERKSFERELREKNLALLRADRMKDQFLASMSHELRTPLHTVIGFSELLAEELRGPLNPEQKRFIQHIIRDSTHLLDLINDILDLSKIEAGRLDLHREVFGGEVAIREVISSLQTLADAKSIHLEASIEPMLALDADRLRFKQILYNLLSNAIKFTPDNGNVRLDAKTCGEQVEISVEDNGVGIPAEDLESVFDKFRQASASTKGVHEGTGLGLTITRALVEHHGGKISLHSVEGEGTRFTFTIPLDPLFPRG